MGDGLVPVALAFAVLSVDRTPSALGFVLASRFAALVPTGFSLPQTCRYVGDPAPDQKRDEVVWRIDCGSAPETRATLAPALTDQSWTLCGSALGVAIWTKDARTLTITEASGNADSRPTLSLRPNSDCP